MPDPEPHDEVRLIAAASRGDRRAFAALVALHRGPVLRFARALAGNGPNADDVFQESFLAAWRGLADYRGEATFRSWLFTITRRTAWRERRRGAREEPSTAERLSALGGAAGWGDESPGPSLTDRLTARDLLQRAFEALPAEERAVIVLRDLEGLTGDEAAAVVGVSLAALKSRLHRARLRLAAELRRLDQEEPDHGP